MSPFLHFIETTAQDLRQGLRQWRKSPGFAFVAVLVLSIGIGANTAIFSTAHTILWSTLPVDNPGSLVRLAAVQQDGRENDSLPVVAVDELLRNSPVLADILTRTHDGLSFSVKGSRTERVIGEAVSPNYFKVLGVRPILGQGFSEDVLEGRWAAQVVLSYRFWQKEFQGDPQVLGKTVSLNGFPFTVVGVSPPNFYSLIVGFEPELRLPHMSPGHELGQINMVGGSEAGMMARLKPGIGISEAEAAVNVEWRHLLEGNVQLQRRNDLAQGIRLHPGDKGWEGLQQFREPIAVLLAMGGLVLLITSTNLAGMLLVRATARSRDFAVRAALGARRGRLVRQMVTESAVLALAAGLIGFAAMSNADRLLLHFLPQGNIPITLNLKPDPLVTWFTMCLVLLTIVLLGLIPALQATRLDLTASLKSDTAASIGAGRGIRIRKALVSSQVALSLLLLIVAGLLWKTLANLRTGDLFPEPNRVMLLTIKPQVELYSAARVRTLTRQIPGRLAGLPGVKSVGLAENGPLGTRSSRATVGNTQGQMINVAMDLVTPGYLGTIGLPFLMGQDFSRGDHDKSLPEVIINEALRRQLFGNEDPVGKTLITPPNSSIQAFDIQGPMTIVGVVKSCRYYDLHQIPPPAIYLNMEQGTAYMPTLHVRLAGGANPPDVVEEVRRELNSLDNGFPVFNIKTLADRVNDSLARERLMGQLASAFGLMAVTLVALGLYGLMAFMVARRTREIGIRMALGANKIDVLRLILGQGLWLTLIGAAVGSVGAIVLTRFLSSLLYGVAPNDPITFILVSLLLIAVALCASYIPARRAANVDPMVALHYQ